MRLYIVFRYMGLMLLLNAVFMLVSAFISLFNGMDTDFYPLMLGFLLTSVLGIFPLLFVPTPGQSLSYNEGYGIVVGSWLAACFAGTIPYLLWGGEFSPVNAWFESVSGYTTTGATILNNVEALPKGLLFWRSATHWLGGVGVVMFALVILPSLGQAKMRLSNVEISSVAKDNYHYHTQKIFRILLVVYLGLTLGQTVLLRAAGMNWFDAVNHAFSTVSTGGFSTKNLSLAYYNNAGIEAVTAIFMALAGIHFGLIFATVTGRNNNMFRNETTRYYLLTLLVGGLLISLDLWKTDVYTSFWSACRYGYFQAVSIASTTGFATADSSEWPAIAMIVLIVFTFQCACAGSTSGGIKCDRVLLTFKAIRAQILQRQHPNAVIRIKMNGVIQDMGMVNAAVLFVIFYILVVVSGTILVAAFGLDLTTSFSVAAASMGNVGPGFGTVGSLDNFHALPVGVKVISTFLMLLGRLELFGLIQLFLFKWWK